MPRSEIAALGSAITEADRLAAEGDVYGGYGRLQAGLRQAQQFTPQRTPWSKELVERWQSVVEEYAQEHRIGTSTELAPAAAPHATGSEPAALPEDHAV